MANIVLGLGTSHSPQLSTPPDLWGLRADVDRRNPRLLWEDGEYYNFEQLLEKVDRQEIAREHPICVGCQHVLGTGVTAKDLMERFLPAEPHYHENAVNVPKPNAAPTPPVDRKSTRLNSSHT